MRRLLFVTAFCAFLAVPALANLTDIGLPNGGAGLEPALVDDSYSHNDSGGRGTDSIMTTLYGSNNYIRVDDDVDQIWMNLDGGAYAEAKFAAATETFGYYDGTSGGSFHSLFSVTQSPMNQWLDGSPSGTTLGHTTMPYFRWALQSQFPTQTSKESDNAGYDQMVTFYIPSLSTANNPVYVVAFEVERLPGGDHDYQDLVVQVSNVAPVPVPGAVLLGFFGLGAAGLKLRRFA